jgi:peptidoglycan/xylan/chitin deacetylase (PgdA/CDA1 family)
MLSLLGLANRWTGVLALNYHRIGDGGRSLFDRGLWSADADGFDQQVRWLKAHADLVTPADLPNLLARRRSRAVLITFDDGYLDNFEAAFPILKYHRVPATFFVTSGFLDDARLSWWDEIAWMVRVSPNASIHGGTWWPGLLVVDEPDRECAVRHALRVYKALPADATSGYLDFLGDATGSGRHPGALDTRTWMSWDMVRQMRAAGMAIGGHTVSHPVLARLSPECQWQEISQCGERYLAELGEPMRWFSYPVGQRDSFNDATRDCLRRAGVSYAFSYYGGRRSFDDWDDLDIRRLPVESDMDVDWVRAAVVLPGVFARAN